MDDLISRRSALDALDEIEREVEDGDGFRYEKWKEHFTELPSAQPYTDEEIQKIQDLEQAQLDKAYELGRQSAQPMRKRGEWIHKGCGCFECDQCGERITLNVYTAEKASERFRFCSMCGADMREGGEDDS